MRAITKIFTLLAAFVTGIFITYLFQHFLLSTINQVDVLIENDAILTKPEVLQPIIENEKQALSPQASKSSTINTEDEKQVTSNKDDVTSKIDKVIPDKIIANKQKKIEKKIDSQQKKRESKNQTTNKKVAVTENTSKESPGIKKAIIETTPKKKEKIKRNKDVKLNPVKISDQKQITNSGFGINYLIKKYWFSKNKPSAFLPSSLNSCVKKNDNKLVCNSQIMEEERFGNVVSFKVKSIITKNENSADRFFVAYRNLILDVKDSENGTTFKTAPVRTGWSKKHTVDCEYTGNKSISCIKDNVHEIEMNGKDR